MSDKLRLGAIGRRFPPDAHRKVVPETTTDPVLSPEIVLREIGWVIAVCLGLALAANLLVAVLPGP
jgi:hypothetical protein